MKFSARNVIKGTVAEIELGSVNAVVKIDIGGGNVITSVVTMDALNELALAVGSPVHAVIKSSSVMIAVD
jgi:molybdopterin-binding protein